MKSLRAWATPVTIGAFLIMAVTGVLMFFHANTGLNKVVHEWAGLIMVAAVVAHLLLNFRAFTTYFKRPLALGFMGLGAAVLGLSFLSLGGTDGGADGMRTAMMALGNARIETLAELSGEDLDAVLAKLGAAGIEASAGQALTELTAGDRGKQDRIIGLIFAR